MGTQQKKKKRTDDLRATTTEIKRKQDLDINQLALQPTFELGYSPIGIGTIDFVNVSTSIGPSQGGGGSSGNPPAQVTGLTVTPQGGSNTQLNLAWTAITASDFNFYTVYSSTTSGFSVGPTTQIAQPTTNSYNNTGLSPGSTYYYRVSVTNDADLEGAPSSQVTGTTTAPADTTPPGQVTGLTTNVMSDDQINLTWTASSASDLNHYDVHRATTSGFTPNTGNRIIQPTTNSFNNTGLEPSTTYYYKVAAVDNAGNIGTYSSQASGTTSGGDTTPPAQTTGLAASVISDTQINLSWTASTATDLNHYDVYRSTTSGFTPGTGNRIAQPTTNSYNNTSGLSASTTYYYKVSAVDNAGNIGAASSQVSGTTMPGGGTGPSPKLLLHLDGNLTDSSGNSLTATLSAGGANNANGYQTPGKFGSSALRLNAPADDDPTFAKIDYINVADNTLLRMSSAFSVSFWVYPTDITAAGPARRKLGWKQDDASNKWEISFDPTNAIIYFCVQKAGVDYKRQITGLAANSWQHICAVFDGSTVEIYKNAVGGATTTGGTQYVSTTGASAMQFGVNPSSIKNTHYEGYIDEVQYFQAALTSTNVTDLMNTNDTGGGGPPPDTTPPGQTVGLTTDPVSSTKINLAWTASAASDLNHYDVHRSTTSGFTPASGNKIATPSTNSYSNTGLTANTTYYYKVAAVDDSANIGAYSAQVSGATPATTAVDTFGTTMLNPTKSGGRVWDSNWHTATSHSWTPSDQIPGNEDPQDDMADLICPDTCKAVVDGTANTMTCDTNTDKASFRYYVKDPGCTKSSSPWKWSPNVEMTIYYRAVSTMTGGTIHVHCRLMGPGEHWNAITDSNPNACPAAGHEYSFEIKDNGTIQLRKEEAHLETTPDGYAVSQISGTDDAPYNTWVGMKLVCQKQGSNMKVEGWRDMTDGASGGNWIKMIEILDDGTNWKLPSGAVSAFNALPTGSGNCVKISPIDRILDMPGSACGLRVDNTKVNFKKFSIREINSA